MTIAIMQPTFLPWIGYMCMIKQVDKFVFLDNVQFETRSWQSRNKIKLQDRTHILSLSCQKAPQKTPIHLIKLDPQLHWRKKILQTLHHAYSKSLNYHKYFPILEKNLLQNQTLVELNTQLITYFCQELNIKTPLFYASKLDLPLAKRENLLFEICQFFKANSYLSPEGSKVYLNQPESIKLFTQGKISIKYFDFIHPCYKQIGKKFIDYLSIIDFLFNVRNPILEFQNILESQS